MPWLWVIWGLVVGAFLCLRILCGVREGYPAPAVVSTEELFGVCPPAPHWGCL